MSLGAGIRRILGRKPVNRGGVEALYFRDYEDYVVRYREVASRVAQTIVGVLERLDNPPGRVVDPLATHEEAESDGEKIRRHYLQAMIDGRLCRVPIAVTTISNRGVRVEVYSVDKSLAEMECRAPSHVFVETVRVYQDEYAENNVNKK
jgi:hypothetical protein